MHKVYFSAKCSLTVKWTLSDIGLLIQTELSVQNILLVQSILLVQNIHLGQDAILVQITLYHKVHFCCKEKF